MFKVNSKDTRGTYFSSVSIVDFEQVNVSWEAAVQKQSPGNAP